MDEPSGKRHTPMEELDFFVRLEAILDEMWDQVVTWDWFAKRVVGVQMMSAADSIAANLVEGDGRFGEADAVRFFRIARASLQEAVRWIKRAHRRKLIEICTRDAWVDQLSQTSRVISKLISYRQEFTSGNRVREDRMRYGDIEVDPDFEPSGSNPNVGPQTSDLGPRTSDLKC
ncbi:MAG: four helix bundle protein [Armatimonadetes bacterium]|nr:four helix bundle protein [Armatimonadota bacterium]